jgi:hypothetical protein
MTTASTTTIQTTLATDLEVTVRLLRSRAASLAAQAPQLPSPLAVAYLRRAEELRSEALLLAA